MFLLAAIAHVLNTRQKAFAFRESRKVGRKPRCNVVVLDPLAFAERKPRHGKTWHLRYEQGRLVALTALPHDDRLEFTASYFGLTIP